MRSKILERATRGEPIPLRPDGAPSHPSPGDVCLGCIHKPDPSHGCHYYWIGKEGQGPSAGGIRFRRADGSEGEASWILLCDLCQVKHAGTLDEDIKAGRVLLNRDMRWPADLKVEFPRD